ncbi:unnamed protein product [Rangifer tarandus platyrhynchus]|uniref:Uncharacterized protein n=1 Tax=Rangifer tarandus platyrhynchus TaxID=3082113 RepID=A0AC59ZU30_RANTA
MPTNNCINSLMPWDFLGGSVLKNPPPEAGVGGGGGEDTDSGSVLGREIKIPCALGQLSLQAETTPHKTVSQLCNKRNPQGAMRSLSTGAGGLQVGREQK